MLPGWTPGPRPAMLPGWTSAPPGDAAPLDAGLAGRSYWIGTVSLIVEAALVTLSVGVLLALRRHLSSR